MLPFLTALFRCGFRLRVQMKSMGFLHDISCAISFIFPPVESWNRILDEPASREENGQAQSGEGQSVQRRETGHGPTLRAIRREASAKVDLPSSVLSRNFL
jgi:hypothetical protein